jgi:uncharacterized protein RhaS with RHS repeats
LGVGGVYYNYFRDYDSQNGRFLQSDPIGLIGGLNTYTYAFNNPMANTDPYGLISLREISANLGLREASRDPRMRGALSYLAAKLAEYAANETCDPVLRGISNLGAAGFALTSSAQFGVAALGSFVVAGSASTTGIGIPASIGAGALGVVFTGIAGMEAVESTRYLEESVRSFKGESNCDEGRPCRER